MTRKKGSKNERKRKDTSKDPTLFYTNHFSIAVHEGSAWQTILSQSQISLNFRQNRQLKCLHLHIVTSIVLLLSSLTRFVSPSIPCLLGFAVCSFRASGSPSLRQSVCGGLERYKKYEMTMKKTMATWDWMRRQSSGKKKNGRDGYACADVPVDPQIEFPDWGSSL